MGADNAFAAVDATLEISHDGLTWVDISGTSNSVEPGGQTRMTGTAYTFGRDLATITSGKREPLEITVNALYTEDPTDTFETIRPWFQSGQRVYFRYSPLGVGATGRAVYTTTNDGNTPGAAVVSSFDYPEISAESADPVALSFQLTTPGLLRTVTGSSTGLGT